MLLLKDDNFYGLAAPLHFLSKLLGLTSFSIQKEKGKFVAKVTFFNAFCILISTVCCIFSTIFFASFYNELSAYLDRLKSSEMFKSCILFTGFSFLYVALLTNWWTLCHRKSFVSIFVAFQELDEGLEAFNIQLKLPRQKRIVWKIISVTVFLVLLNILMTYFFLIERMKRTVCFTFITIWIYFATMVFCFVQFSCLTWSVKFRYVKINEFLSENFVMENSEKLSNKNLGKIAKLHDKLVDITEIINRCYGIPVNISVISS